MKQFFVLLLILICSTISFAQQKMSTAARYAIPASVIQQKSIGKLKANYISLTSLKKGWNYVTLQSGNQLEVEFENNKITGFKLTSSSGKSLGEIKIPSSPSTAFMCSGNFCICHGDGDCNDMFSTSLCGPTATCYGDYCVCAR